MNISKFKFQNASGFRFSQLKTAILLSLFYATCAVQQASALEVVAETSLIAGNYPITSDGQVSITITGADGGNATAGSTTAGGSGAGATGVFTVSDGDIVYYVVGGVGLDGGSGGGGGSTGVYINNTLVLVSGAGGGGDNSTGQIGLGGNATTSGDAGTGSNPGAAGAAGTGGGAGGLTNSGGGGGISSAGDSGQPSNGGGQADGTVPLNISSGGDASGYTGTAGNGGAGFSGGGGADPTHYSGGGGGYSGGGGAGANGAAGGGGSFHNTSATGWISSSTSDGADGAGTQSDGTLTLVFCSASDDILNQAAVSSATADPDLANNTSTNCTEMASSDFGDAPSSYMDAQHTIVAGAPYIGLVPGDADPGTQSDPGNAATGDDDDAEGDDEDGVTFSSPAGGGDDIRATVVVVNPSAVAVTLCGWMDVNVNGDFSDVGEMQCNTAINPSTTFSWVVSDVTTQNYYTRFRVCTVAAECNVPASMATDGEVEDHRINYSPTAVTIGAVDLKATGAANFLAELGVGQLNAAALLKLLDTWAPEAAANLVESDREAILSELRNFLDPDGDGQVAVLAWDTLEERGTIGFYVERQQGGGVWLRINNDMLPGLITAPMGGEYFLADPGASAGQVYQYRLIEQEARGSTRTYGPFTVEMQ